jgi:hypothetical protein
MFRALTIALISALSLSTNALAGPLEDGTAALARGDYSNAQQILLPLAEQGNDRLARQVNALEKLLTGVSALTGLLGHQPPTRKAHAVIAFKLDPALVDSIEAAPAVAPWIPANILHLRGCPSVAA